MEITSLLLSLFIILVAAKVGGELAERIHQPAVLGELVAGVIVGASVLGLIREDSIISVLAQIGAIVLLFEAGITSDYEAFMSVKLWAFLVACVGVACPFVLGYFVSHYSGLGVMESIFIGATLTATSVGITVRVFQDLGKIKMKEAQIVIGAAVVDDVIGLIILAVVTGIVTSGSVSIANILRLTGYAAAFLGGAIVIGSTAAPYLLKFVHQMRVRGVLFVFAFAFCLILAYFSQLVGLAPIVGAFAAGLILSRTEHQEHVEKQTKPLADIFVPIFFVMMGAAVNINLFNPFNPANHAMLIFAGLIFAVAIFGKIVSGWAVFEKLNKVVIGIGMLPRGEVGLIFAAYGLSHKIIGQQLYVAVLLVIMLTTFITPPLLKMLVAKNK
ncbi:MAG: cation:proton antiporter [Candidatus Margulisbacteria bacterium]|nr:cation:proton antiporter [Candidatus Margulisiibacteriota bacterium]